MRLYLIPSPLWAGDASSIGDQTAPATLWQIHRLQCFWVERAKTTRAFLQAWRHPLPIQSLEIIEFEKSVDLPAFFAQRRHQGRDVGLLSEAGCPALADPGANVVALAHRAGWQVIALGGSSAITLALIASGLNGQQFYFHGYLPVRPPEKISTLKSHLAHSRADHATQIYIETPYRSQAFIETIVQYRETLIGKPAPQSTLWFAVSAAINSPQAISSSKPLSEWTCAEAEKFQNLPAIFMLGYQSGLMGASNTRSF